MKKNRAGQQTQQSEMCQTKGAESKEDNPETLNTKKKEKKGTAQSLRPSGGYR